MRMAHVLLIHVATSIPNSARAKRRCFMIANMLRPDSYIIVRPVDSLDDIVCICRSIEHETIVRNALYIS
jgi:hypothetical protein